LTFCFTKTAHILRCYIQHMFLAIANDVRLDLSDKFVLGVAILVQELSFKKAFTKVSSGLLLFGAIVSSWL
jgi:hypothetical protein